MNLGNQRRKMTKIEYKKYLKQELVHSGFHDGWCIRHFEKELKKLEENKDAEESNS